jgi:hypothetical protein
MSSARTLILIALGASIVAGAANARPSATPAASHNSCRVIAVGNQGGAGSPGSNFSSVGTAGGVALGAKAFGGITVNCNNYSDVLTITAPGHTFSTTKLVRCGGPCTSSSCKATNATTLTCRLSKDLEAEGIKAVGSWQATLQWLYARTDKAATNTTDGTCHINVVAAVALAGKASYSGKSLSACAYAKGDAVR